jgi:hypothetical protein
MCVDAYLRWIHPQGDSNVCDPRLCDEHSLRYSECAHCRARLHVRPAGASGHPDVGNHVAVITSYNRCAQNLCVKCIQYVFYKLFLQ